MVYAYRFTTSEVPAKVPVATKSSRVSTAEGSFFPHIHSDVGTRSSSGAACAAFQQAQFAQLEILENGFQKWISYHLENCD